VGERPVVVISRCIDFDSCRYNGQVIRASLREQLEPLVELRPICPELEIGLGVPRDPVRLVARRGRVEMVQPATGRNLTDRMEAFSKRYLDALDEVDGFILKSRSPSCAVRDYEGGPGLFAARVLERFPHAVIEDEARLADEAARGRFIALLHEARRTRLRGTGESP
jgi:uncharacterized protein YbbK (DUF523 family)